MRRLRDKETMTAHELVGSEKMVLFPNKSSQTNWERICDEEVFMSKYVTSIQLLGLPVVKCVVESDTINGVGLGLYAPTLDSFQHLKAHVIETKRLLDCTWNPHSRLLLLDGQEIDWLPVFQPLYNDLVNALHNGLVLRSHLLLAEQGSPYYCGTGVYALRYFGCQFSHPEYAMIQPVPGDSHFLNMYEVLCMADDSCQGTFTRTSGINLMKMVKLSMMAAVDTMDYLLGQRIVQPQLESYLQTLL